MSTAHSTDIMRRWRPKSRSCAEFGSPVSSAAQCEVFGNFKAQHGGAVEAEHHMMHMQTHASCANLMQGTEKASSRPHDESWNDRPHLWLPRCGPAALNVLAIECASSVQ